MYVPFRVSLTFSCFLDDHAAIRLYDVDVTLRKSNFRLFILYCHFVSYSTVVTVVGLLTAPPETLFWRSMFYVHMYKHSQHSHSSRRVFLW
jgi:hypothetical protein